MGRGSPTSVHERRHSRILKQGDYSLLMTGPRCPKCFEFEETYDLE
jgi:predicted Zn-ribbon and HTH transcriptional regulator